MTAHRAPAAHPVRPAGRDAAPQGQRGGGRRLVQRAWRPRLQVRQPGRERSQARVARARQHAQQLRVERARLAQVARVQVVLPAREAMTVLEKHDVLVVDAASTTVLTW